MPEAKEQKKLAAKMPEGRRDVQSQLPLMLAAMPEAGLAAGGSAVKYFEFDFPYTVLSMHSAVLGQKTPHTDFRLEIERNIGSERCQNLPFSARALLGTEGFDFVKETGAPMYVDAGDALNFTFHNDSGFDFMPQIIFRVYRGHITKFGDKEFDKSGLEVFGGKEANYIKSVGLIPFVIVISPGAIAPNSQALKEFKFSHCYSLLRAHYAVRGTAEGVTPVDFRIGIKLAGNIPQYNELHSAKAWTNDNEGFDFSEINKTPLVVDGKNDDRFDITFRNDSSAIIHPSIELLTYRYQLTEKGLKKLTANK